MLNEFFAVRKDQKKLLSRGSPVVYDSIVAPTAPRTSRGFAGLTFNS
jgi:hypothetical protein